jgi:hypothetical protein
MGQERRGWVGVDLDGTLAEYHGWKGETHIGHPVPKMVERVKGWLREGRLDVRIFTARVSSGDPEERRVVTTAIKEWCREHIGEALEVTNTKDYQMVELWDDRAFGVVCNTGELK